jgi:hypothetical protein
MTDELSLLQTLRLKGRADIDTLASALNTDVSAVEELVDQTLAAESTARAGKAFKLAPAGKERLATLVAAERESLDSTRLESLYKEFDPFNSELKALITHWQMKDPDTANDHTDAGYDATIVQHLVTLHSRFGPWLQRLAEVNSRLTHYGTRLNSAVAAVQAGDHSFIAKPITDSYHTVWFELHQELIDLLGRDRATEAAAGRAV